MYSAELDKKTVLALRRALKAHLPVLAKKLSAINKILLEKRKACQAEGQEALVEHGTPGKTAQGRPGIQPKGRRLAGLESGRPSSGRNCWIFISRAATTCVRPNISTLSMCPTLNARVRPISKQNYSAWIQPPCWLPRWNAANRPIFFSATLLPMDYFKKLLTGAADHPKRIFRSPFPLENVSLLIHNRISTKYAQRADSYAAIASAIETICGAQVGNYLVFFPSYAYLAAVLELLKERLPEEQLLVQDRGMTEAEREAFLAQFSADNQETLIGFAVMGGIFGEGIDLVGERLIGAVVVGVGIPQLGLERDLIKDYFDQHNGSGFAYAYQYPGFNRVLQATGRVIRTETDRGIIVLIDERFTHARYRRLFPATLAGISSRTERRRD